ncbi:SDA1-domain-containing protein [Pseudomassariella vexata]|uniref:Protein SDA1 n=1 Tax=Pseudomassariella vexata TaxID=1141098 RepID=A0A1Y2DA87_9PEZI|nr:SDA1-domain-containing protein [Pseudomassariella vexata]ORY56169.1 SDA1-domain-containing protein [Pseudomassariella vexata]
MGKRKVTALEKTEANLASLQYKIRGDPRSYEKEFETHWGQYESSRDQFLDSPIGSDSNSLISFREQIDLIAHVSDCYPEATSGFANDLREILTRHHAVLETELREKIVSSLVLLRRKELIDSSYLLTTLFPILVSTPSKTLRALLYSKILSDLRNANTKATNHKLNRTMQQVLYNLVASDRSSPKAVWAVKITREMWKRQLWTDTKPVDIMKEACLADNEKVVGGGVRFFLGGDKEREEIADDSSDEDNIDVRKVKHQIGINKKSKKKAKALDKAVDKVKRQERKKNAPHPLNFSALHLLHDPQGFAENLFQKHLLNSKAKLTLETRLLILQLVTRLVGLHKLTVIALYPWFTKYLTPRQESVTSFMASLAQATHNLVPPDVLEPLIVKIANEFVSEASAPEVAAAGLNAIRETCARQPLAMTDTLLQDLVQYRKSKDKGTAMAAKGLLSLYREQAAELLAKRDRGKQATMNLKTGEQRQQKFGEEQVGGIEGLELLAKWKEDERKRKRAEKGLPEDGEDGDVEDDEEDSDGWEVASIESSDSGEWIRVSDSEDEAEPVAKKQRRGSENLNGDDSTENAEEELKALSLLATTQILTPADLAKLHELRIDASIDKAMGNRNRKKQDESRHTDEGLTAEQIEAPAKLRKSTKEERVAMAKDGKPGREEHKSTQAIRKSKKEAEGKSTTNKEKARKKNFLMTLGKAKSKQKRSLVDTRKVLHNHISRSKSGGRRRNGVAK